MPSKKTTKEFKQYPKIYWINDNDYNYSKIQGKFSNREGIHKVSKFYVGNDEKEFICLNLTCELTEEEFYKLASSINKYLDEEFKVFYKFGEVKHIYIPEKIEINLNEVKNAIINFIDN